MYNSYIYNYLCYQGISLKCCEFESHAWRSTAWQSVLDATLCDKVCQWLWFSPGTRCNPQIKHFHDVAEILLKVVLNTHKFCVRVAIDSPCVCTFVRHRSNLWQIKLALLCGIWRSNKRSYFKLDWALCNISDFLVFLV